jgi:syntaxin 16
VSKTTQLEEVHRRRLLTFDDSEQQRYEREIDILTKSITVKFQESEKILKRILATGSKPGNTDERVRRNIQRSLAIRLQELSGAFRQAQRSYLAKLQKKKKETEGEGFGGSNDGGVASEDIDQGFNEYQQEMIRTNFDYIDQRDKEIMEIANSIEDLAIVFKELAVLVIDQGTILDRIDYNMEVAVDRVDDGVVQLEKARKYQKASRPIKCICFLVLVIFILIIMLIMKHSGGDSPSPPPAEPPNGGRLLSVM